MTAPQASPVTQGQRPKAPTPKQYAELRVELALDFAPSIHACKKCGWPVVSGYCCTTCGDTDPKSSGEQA